MKPSKKQHSYTYPFPKADNTVDIVVFGLRDATLEVLLVRRRDDPYKGQWALPGGFVNMDETLEQAAQRELREETSAEVSHLEQLYTFGDPGRDPRGRVISVVYMALVRSPEIATKAGDDAVETRWFPVENIQIGTLAFDHDKILDLALTRLRSKARWQPLGVGLLPEEGFTLSELQTVYESILGRPLDKRNFRRKVLSFGLLYLTRQTRHPKEGGHQARVYKFDQGRLTREGIDFEV